MKSEEKNVSDKPSFICDQNICSNEKENTVPNYPTSAAVLGEHESTMLRYGEFSPNNPKMRVSTQPYLGLGEYEQRRGILLQQRKADYQQYAQKMKHTREPDNAFIKNNFKNSRPVSTSRDKAVQTDIQDVNSRLVQYDLSPRRIAEKEKLPRGHGVKIDKVQIETQNSIIIPDRNRYVDRTGSNRDNSPRAKLMADLQSSYFPTLMGYSPVNTEDEDKLEKVRRQEIYLSELRQQIEEKQRLVAKHKEQERREQEIDSRRLDTQIREMSLDEKQLLSGHSLSLDLPVNSKEFENKAEKPYAKSSRWSEKRYKPRMLESTLTHHSDVSENKFSSKHSLVNSPTPSRRDKKQPPYSFNIATNSVFANSMLPVNDSVERQTQSHAKLVNDIGNSTTKLDSTQKRVHRQINTNKLDESLPIAVLKEPSPVAKELKNAVAVQSKSSDAMRKLEDKWQVPIVQKNIKNKERLTEGVNNQGILTQLGAIRLQLQQEQLRLDETLRKRGTSHTVVHADVHHNLT
ncbi:hypothetical protein CBL_03688 [Carabus blaptoides fortunei]